MNDDVMTINNFADYFDSLMLSKGRDYYKNHIVSFINDSDNHFVATIEGSMLYVTQTLLSDDGEIINNECTCPFKGEVCKHQIALFYKIAQFLEDEKRALIENNYYESLQKAFKTSTNKTLIDIIFALSKNSLKSQNEVLAIASVINA